MAIIIFIIIIVIIIIIYEKLSRSTSMQNLEVLASKLTELWQKKTTDTDRQTDICITRAPMELKIDHVMVKKNKWIQTDRPTFALLELRWSLKQLMVTNQWRGSGWFGLLIRFNLFLNLLLLHLVIVQAKLTSL